MSLGEPPSGERHRPPVAEYMAASGQVSVPRVEERRPTMCDRKLGDAQRK